jgi:hypothetical protein
MPPKFKKHAKTGKSKAMINAANPSARKVYLTRTKKNVRTMAVRKKLFGHQIANDYRKEAAIQEQKERAFRAAKKLAKKKSKKVAGVR